MKAQVKSKLNLENRVPLQDVIPIETPFLLYLDPSSACNFKCAFCPTGHLDLVRQSGYRRRILPFELFEKFIVDLGEFPKPLRVLRMNKIGEPLLNRHLAQMIALAKSSGRVEWVDFATNGALLTPPTLEQMIDAGLDRINISLEGISSEQYLEHAGVDIDYPKLVETIRWLYENRRGCEVTLKVPGDYLSEAQKEEFFRVFGDCCDRIFIENLSPIWPGFDLENRTGMAVDRKRGQYEQQAEVKAICTYIFYAMAINADGTVSACCPDWEQKLVVGDLRRQTLKEIWNSEAMHRLRLTHLAGRRGENPTCAQCEHIVYSQVDNIDPYREALLARYENYCAGPRESDGSGMCG